eukprot:s1267_g20.t1
MALAVDVLPVDVLANVASFVANEPAATTATRCMRGAAAMWVWTGALRCLWRSRGRYDTEAELIRHQVWVECRAPRNLPQTQPPRLAEHPLRTPGASSRCARTSGRLQGAKWSWWLGSLMLLPQSMKYCTRHLKLNSQLCFARADLPTGLPALFERVYCCLTLS